MTLDWTAVTALCAVCALISGAAIWAIAAIVDRKIADFFIQLNGTYLRRELAMSEFHLRDERISQLERHLPRHRFGD